MSGPILTQESDPFGSPFQVRVRVGLLTWLAKKVGLSAVHRSGTSVPSDARTLGTPMAKLKRPETPKKARGSGL